MITVYTRRRRRSSASADGCASVTENVSSRFQCTTFDGSVRHSSALCLSKYLDGQSPATGGSMTGTGERAAVVTGAASGIGRAITERLRADGVRTLAVDRAAEPDDPDSLGVDLTTREGNRAAVQVALDRFGRLDIVVANAGFQHVAPIAEFDPDRWDELLKILLTSPFLLAHYGWKALSEAGTREQGGRFLAIASAHSLVASPFKAGYVSAKHGVLGLVRTLAVEGAEIGLSASALCPGYVRTPLVEAQIADQAKAHGLTEDRVLSEVILARQAVKRLLEPAEVADAAAFLLGPAGRGFTGAAVPMDYGWTAR
jgi:3-hydroxybutyrate dehydrogenase